MRSNVVVVLTLVFLFLMEEGESERSTSDTRAHTHTHKKSIGLKMTAADESFISVFLEYISSFFYYIHIYVHTSRLNIFITVI